MFALPPDRVRLILIILRRQLNYTGHIMSSERNYLRAESREIILEFALRENTEYLNNSQGISTEYLLNKSCLFFHCTNPLSVGFEQSSSWKRDIYFSAYLALQFVYEAVKLLATLESPRFHCEP